jgi:hypothetical protein
LIVFFIGYPGDLIFFPWNRYKLLVEPTELDAINDDWLMISVEKSALGVGQGTQAEEAHNG